MKLLITGATGLVGSHITRTLSNQGHKLVVLTRNLARCSGKLPTSVTAYEWHPLVGPPPEAALDGIDIVIHLCGEPVVSRRWSTKQKRRIRDSRVVSTQNLVGALTPPKRQPKLLVAASAIGFYGDGGDRELAESSPPGEDFLAEVCRDWEQATKKLAASGTRVVNLRIGVVLAKQSGILEKMLPIFRLGLGGKLGNGKQWMSWIHITDLVQLILHIIEVESLSGPVNGVSPTPVTNSEFTQLLGRCLRRPAFCHVPKPLLRLTLGEVSSAILGSQRVLPKKALQNGASFRFTNLYEALTDLLR